MRLGLIFQLCAQLLMAGLLTAGPVVAAETDPLPKDMALKGNFEHQRQLQGFDNPLISKGFFVLVPKVALLWQTNEPVKSRIVIAKGMVRQILDGQETFAKPLAQAGGLGALSDLLQAALGGDWRALRKNFKIETKSQDGIWRNIYRHDGGAGRGSIKRIEFLGRRYVNEIRIFHGNGDRDEIRFFGQMTVPRTEAISRFGLK